MTTLLLRRDFWVEWVCLIPLAAILVIGGLAFGGQVWWYRPLAIAGVGLTIGGGLMRLGLRRDRLFLASPLLVLGVGALGWAAFQCLPLPHGLVARIAPLSEAAFSRDQAPLPAELAANGASGQPQNPLGSRIPISLNRAESVRRALWLCLGLCVFWFAGRWTDRSSKLLAIAGFVIALGATHSAILTLQLLDGSEGFYGLFTPNQRYFVGPGLVDLAASPHRSELIEIEGIPGDAGVWTLQRPTEIELIGIMPGGLVTFGCLQTIALPMCFGCLCYLAQRRGSRFAVRERLEDRGVATLFGVLTIAGILSATLGGIAMPGWVAAPMVLGLAVSFLWAIRADLEWWVPIGLMILFGIAFVAGQRIFAAWTISDDSAFQRYWLEPAAFSGFLRENLEIWRRAGWTGIGLGAYSQVASYVKTSLAASSVAASSAIGLVLELGIAAIVAIALAYAWIGLRLARGFRHVGYEQRCLLGMILGTLVAVMTGIWLSPGWENPLLLLVVCALLGVADRALCGASDLLMESWDEA